MRNAERFVAQGKISAAIGEYKNVVDNDPRDYSTLNMLGDLYSKNSQKNEAVRCYTKVAEHYNKQGFAQKAIAVYKKIAKLKPDSVEVSTKLAELYHAKGSVSEARSHYLSLADHYQKKGQKMEALAIWKQMALLDPNNTEVYLSIAESYSAENQPDEACEAFTQAGERFSRAGMVEQAVSAYSNALDLKGDAPIALRGLVDALDAVGRGSEAIDRLETAAEYAPHDGELLSTLMTCYLRERRASDAERVVSRLIQHDQSNFEKYLELARLYLDSGDTSGATRALNLSSEFMLSGGRADEFKDRVDEVLAFDPRSLEALRLRARFCSFKRDDDGLRRTLDEIASIAAEAGSVEDERYALSQLVMVVPQEAAYGDRLRKINEQFGFDENPYDDAILRHQYLEQDLAGEEASFDSFAVLADNAEIISADPAVSSGSGAKKKSKRAAEPPPAEAAEPDPRLLERNGEEQEAARADYDPVESAIAREVESIHFYIESGYNELAETTLNELCSAYGNRAVFDELRERIGVRANASEVYSDLTPAAIEINQPEPVTSAGFGLDDLRHEFGLEDSEPADGDDYDTHYQLAVAYQEMGLMEEAIKEYQDAINQIPQGDQTRRFFQCAHLLGHCFMQNGMAKLALKWYNRALEIPDLNDDEKQGIWFELGAAYEAEGDLNNAARFFEQVYAENVDFRNVGDRIKNLMVPA
jgi:tetratricopeptide (TPR) repeat protein